MVTDSNDPKHVFILLELYRKTQAGDYLMTAKRVCENIADPAGMGGDAPYS